MKRFLEILYKCFNQKQSKEDFFINFAVFMSIGFIFDILIYEFIVGIIRFVLLGVYTAYTGPKYDSAQFNVIKIFIIILLVVVYHFMCVDVINDTKRNII